eukprot:CAMPEP_0173384192 /NCGR_PEP_ID=MMETSP1356-20130122/6763_1 /TAXON_ID=77927 ORGANISM="Hemiselmis virescens, Strain PCC157" /NCGR_SAMPLE_ID=MMETSP1356 /ASSEMBLY_ACC=CAM_ASM_000847 /LENGTH=43 /DNA_ID= /DNA_START= /DNA_END= /DNA_ORIENTATION=
MSGEQYEDGTPMQGWKNTNFSFIKGKHVKDPNNAWQPHFIAGV